MAKTLGGESTAAGAAITQDAADQADMTAEIPPEAAQSSDASSGLSFAGPSPAALSPDGLSLARAVKGPPPVHLWNPPFCGDLDMRITRDGTWIHEGRPITRHALVQMFGTILKREGEDYMLVTPVEKVRITVEDVPFIAVDVDRRAEGFTFTTNLGDRVMAGPDHALEMRAGAPYVHIRRDLWARVDRKSFYRLAEAMEARGAQSGICSQGVFFPLD